MHLIVIHEGKSYGILCEMKKKIGEISFALHHFPATQRICKRKSETRCTNTNSSWSSIDEMHTHIRFTNLRMWFVYKSPKSCSNEWKKSMWWKSHRIFNRCNNIVQQCASKKHIVDGKTEEQRHQERKRERERSDTKKLGLFVVVFFSLSRVTCILSILFLCSVALWSLFSFIVWQHFVVSTENFIYFFLKNDLTDSKQITCMNGIKLKPPYENK